MLYSCSWRIIMIQLSNPNIPFIRAILLVVIFEPYLNKEQTPPITVTAQFIYCRFCLIGLLNFLKNFLTHPIWFFDRARAIGHKIDMYVGSCLFNFI